MSNMKMFTVWLTECIYKYRMSEAEIIHAFQVRCKAQCSRETITWLREQIRVVKSDSQTFLSMLN
jgi:hypothetical protein